MINQKSRWEILTLVILLIAWPFLATNYSTNLSTIYAIFTLSAIVYVILDIKRDIQFKKESDSFLTSVLIAGVATVAFIAFSSTVIIPGTKAFLHLLSSTTPVLANNALTQKIVFGILVAATETLFFFVYLFDLLASIFNLSLTKNNLFSTKLWILIICLALLFVGFHLTAKAGGTVEQTAGSLAAVFFMAVFSMFLVVWRGQALEAVLFHVILNSIAVNLIPFI